MKEFWNARYGEADYAYGEKPNTFLKEKLEGLQAASILFPAEGEGRNAVYAAKCDWQVSAFDMSQAGREKANALAKKNAVSIDYLVSNLEDIHYKMHFNAVALIFAHFPKDKRAAYHKKLADYLLPGGYLILEGFSKNHLAYSATNEKVGGPKDVNMLFSVAEIAADFQDFEVLELTEKVVELKEGIYHDGIASVVRFFGRKK